MAAAGKRDRYAFTAARQAGQAARQGYGRRQAIRTAGMAAKHSGRRAAGMAGKRQGSTAAAGQAVEGRRQAKTAARQA